MLGLPYLTCLAVLQIAKLSVANEIDDPFYHSVSMVSGTLIPLLSIVSVGFLAQPTGSTTHFANLLTGSLVASFVLIDPLSVTLALWPEILWPCLFLAIGSSIAIWVNRRRKISNKGT